MSGTEPLIRIRDLRFRYPGSDHDVLRIPFLDVGGTGLIAVTGPSAAGKSTLIEILAGTLRGNYSGSVQVLGREWSDIRRDADRQRHLRRVGFIPQDYGLLADRSVADLLGQDLSDSGTESSEHQERKRRALYEVALDGFEERQVAALSGGQRQRLAIARMLARDVELVIADEPTANLDPALTQETIALFRRLAEHSPVLIITHDPSVAAACDRTIVLQSTVADAEPTNAQSPSRNRTRRARTLWMTGIGVLAITAATSFAIITGVSGKPNAEHTAGGTRPTTPGYDSNGDSSTTKDASTTATGQVRTAKATSLDSLPVEGRLPLPSGSPPAPNLARLLSPNAHVASENWVRLAGRTPQVVVTDTQPVDSPNGNATDLVLFGWDSFAARWEIVFDAAKTSAGVGSDSVILPANAWVEGLTYATISPTPGRTDLAFWASVNFGADNPFAAYILHYDGQTASVVYSNGGESGTAKVIGAAPYQQLSLTTEWIDAADAECCPVRNYTQTVSWSPRPLPGMSTPTGYQVLSDTRSWMGVYVASDFDADAGTGASAVPPPVVMTVVPNSPAAGVLQRGDKLLSVSGAPHLSNPATLGPAIIDQIDSHQPGALVTLNIQRGNQYLTRRIKLSSYANPAEAESSPPAPGWLGVEIDTTNSPSAIPGAYIESVDYGSVAFQAGLQGGDVVTSFGTSQISTGQQLHNALLASPAGTTAQLVYVDSSGASHVVTVTLGTWPAPSSSSSGQTPSVFEI